MVWKKSIKFSKIMILPRPWDMCNLLLSSKCRILCAILFLFKMSGITHTGVPLHGKRRNWVILHTRPLFDRIMSRSWLNTSIAKEFAALRAKHLARFTLKCSRHEVPAVNNQCQHHGISNVLQVECFAIEILSGLQKFRENGGIVQNYNFQRNWSFSDG